MQKAGIVDGPGYTGLELLQIFAAHLDAGRVVVTSPGEAATRALRGIHAGQTAQTKTSMSGLSETVGIDHTLLLP